MIGDCFRVVDDKYIGEVGDPVFVLPRHVEGGICGNLPDGKKIKFPFLIGKIISKEHTPDWPRFLIYEYEAIIGMEDGSFIKAKGQFSPDIAIYNSIGCPCNEYRILKFSEYLAYEKYLEERAKAREEFEKEWDRKCPIQLKPEVNA